MDEPAPWDDIKEALQRLKAEHPGAVPLMITSAGLQRIVDEWGAEEARRLLYDGIIATMDHSFVAVIGHRGVIVEDVAEFERWGPGPMFIEAKTYRPGDRVRMLAAEMEAIAVQKIDLPETPRHPAHNAPNRRRFKRSQRKR